LLSEAENVLVEHRLLDAAVRASNPDFDPSSGAAERHAQQAFLRWVEALVDAAGSGAGLPVSPLRSGPGDPHRMP